MKPRSVFIEGHHVRKSRALLALALAALVAVPGVWAIAAEEAGAAPGDPPLTAAELRVAYVGTAHRSVGVVAGAGADAVTEPLFDADVQHFDDEASARGATVTWVSRRTSRLAQVWVRVGGGDPVQLTSDPDRVASHPVISPDGTAIAYAMTREGPGSDRDIWVVPVRGGEPRRVTDGTGDNHWPSWSPDGTEIAFEGERGSDIPQVWCVPAAGGPIRFMTDVAGGAGEPSWNPVASRNLIAYTAAPNSANDRKVHIAGRDGSNDRLMLDADWESHQPVWSPDGVTVAFVSRSTQPSGTLGGHELLYSGEPRDDGCACVAQLRYDEDRSISTPSWYDPDGAGVRLLITRTTAADRFTAHLADVRPDGVDPRDLGVFVLREDPAAATDPNRLWNPVDGDPWTSRPSYSPDGRTILFSRFESEGAGRVARLWTVGADGAGARRLDLPGRTATGSETEAVWSPDGARIAYSLRTPGTPARIVVVEVATGVRVTLAGNGDPIGDTQPVWSPDGRQLAFTRGQAESTAANSHVWLASADGSGAQLDISANAGGAGRADYGAGFSPDGSRLAFGRAPDGMLVTDLSGRNCRVLTPAGGACSGPLTAPETGPHHPRDVDWSPDGTQLAHAARRYAAAVQPDYVKTYDLADGVRDGLTWEIPGRHRWPDWQRASDLRTTVVGAPERFTAGGSTTVTLSVTDNGPVRAHGVRVVVEAPDGFRVTALDPATGACDLPTLTCELGSPGIGGTALVRVTVTAPAAATGSLSWTARGWLADAAPLDNTAEVELRAEAPPAPSPSISIGAPSVPPVPPAPPVPPGLPLLQVSVVINPTPTWVGHRTTVRYTVRNIGGGTATGVTVTPRLPAGIPVVTRPANCDATVCRVGDLTPGTASELTFVLVPQRPVVTTVTGTITGDALVVQGVGAPLRVLQPRIEATPELGPPGFVTIIRGFDFPPGVPVSLAWDTGVTVAANPAVPDARGGFDAQLLVLWKDPLGQRKAVATGIGFTPVTADFRVVAPAQQPPGLVLRK